VTRQSEQEDGPGISRLLRVGLLFLVLQLAVNKQGVIRGNYTDTISKQTQPVHGSVDKASQTPTIA